MPDLTKHNRNAAAEYIPGLIEEGYTNTEITNMLRDQGLSYRNQNMYTDINRYRLEQFGATDIRRLGFDAPIPEKLMRERNVRTDYNYSAVVKYGYIDANTGLEIETGTTLYFDDRPSQADVLEAFAFRSESLQNQYSNIEQISAPERVYYYRHNQ